MTLVIDWNQPQHTNVDRILVKDGWCWWYRKYAPENTMLEGLESETREAQRGCGSTRIPCLRGSGGLHNGKRHSNLLVE